MFKWTIITPRAQLINALVLNGGSAMVPNSGSVMVPNSTVTAASGNLAATTSADTLLPLKEEDYPNVVHWT